jgi:hypothetical protein
MIVKIIYCHIGLVPGQARTSQYELLVSDIRATTGTVCETPSPTGITITIRTLLGITTHYICFRGLYHGYLCSVMRRSTPLEQPSSTLLVKVPFHLLLNRIPPRLSHLGFSHRYQPSTQRRKWLRGKRVDFIVQEVQFVRLLRFCYFASVSSEVLVFAPLGESKSIRLLKFRGGIYLELNVIFSMHASYVYTLRIFSLRDKFWSIHAYLGVGHSLT